MVDKDQTAPYLFEVNGYTLKRKISAIFNLSFFYMGSMLTEKNLLISVVDNSWEGFHLPKKTNRKLQKLPPFEK